MSVVSFFLRLLLASIMVTSLLNCDTPGTGDGSGTTETTATPMGGVKILLTNIVAPAHPENEASSYSSGNNGNNENCNGVGYGNGNGNGSGNPHCEEYDRPISAIIVGLTKVDVYSTSRGWVEAINLVSDIHPDGSFFELIGVKNGATPELGFFQLEKDDYTGARFYFGSRNYVIARDSDGVLKDYALKIETDIEDDTETQSYNARLKRSSKGYRVKNSSSKARTLNEDSGSEDDSDNDEESEERYIELQVSGGFYIDPNSVTEITIGVDPLASIRQHKDKYSLHPVISVTNVATTAGASTLISAANGGTISMDNEVTIDIPPGALAQDTYVAIIPKQKPTAGNYRPEFIDMKNYVFLPHGLTMNSDATLTMQYDPGFINDLNKVSGNDLLSEHFVDIQYFDPVEQRYRSTGRNIDFNNHTAVAQINHFSDWVAALILSTDALAAAWDIITMGTGYSAAATALTWQLRVNDILNAGGDWNTTRIDPSTQLPIYDSLGNVSFYSIRDKDANGNFKYLAYKKTGQHQNPVYPNDPSKVIVDIEKTNGVAVIYTITDVANPVYVPFRPKFIPDVENLIVQNSDEYTPGYPLQPALFMISQFADIVLNPNLDQNQDKSGVPANMAANTLFLQVDGYASVSGLSMLYSDVTLGAYLFFHAAQRHDLCDGRGGMYQKTYNECNADFYGDKNNPEAMQYGSDGKPVYPARFPSFYNTATICNEINDPLTKDRCWLIRENFMTAVSLKADHPPSAVCDDYELQFVDNPSTPPTADERHQMCYVNMCVTDINGVTTCSETTYDQCIPDSATTCDITDENVQGMIDYLANHGLAQFNGLTLDANREIEPISASSFSIDKVCPIGNPAYLSLTWNLDNSWASMPRDYVHIYNDQIEIYLNRANVNGTPSGVLVDFIFKLGLGTFISVPPDESVSSDRVTPFYYTQFPDIMDFLPVNSNSTEYKNLFNLYADIVSPWPTEPAIWPLGNYTYTMKKAVTGEILVPGYTEKSHFSLSSPPISKDWCNHELLNLCVDPWWHDTSCPP